MLVRWFAMLGSVSLPLVAKGCALLLILAAVAGTAQAGPPGPPGSVPEIDPGSLLSAMALLGGGALLLTEKLRRK
jgi:hypothetical protein